MCNFTQIGYLTFDEPYLKCSASLMWLVATMWDSEEIRQTWEVGKNK